jgi:hypothetical protein
MMVLRNFERKKGVFPCVSIEKKERETTSFRLVICPNSIFYCSFNKFEMAIKAESVTAQMIVPNLIDDYIRYVNRKVEQRMWLVGQKLANPR